MRCLIQRVTRASVTIAGSLTSSIAKGLLIFVGIAEEDNYLDIEWLCGKISGLRIFNDAAGVMNFSVSAADAEILVVSQFTLHASTKKGNRPSYIRAARPETAIPLYEKLLQELSIKSGVKVSSGIFGADMQVELINDGPVTIFIDSKIRE